MNPKSLAALRAAARTIWLRCRRDESAPSATARETMRAAYWANVLPTDPDFDVAQWVEDGCPNL